MTTILVVARNTLLRAGVMQLLDSVVPELTVFGFGYTDLERPPEPVMATDLLLLSIASPERFTSLVLASLKAFAPKRIILMAEGPPMRCWIENLPYQVVGYIDKSSPSDIFVDSVRRVLAGETCFPWQIPDRTGITSSAVAELQGVLPASARHALLTTKPDTSPKVVSEPNLKVPYQNALPLSDGISEADLLGLTQRQYTVLVFLARGLSLKAVARVLNISLGTTKTHTESVYMRLGAHNRQEAINIAMARGAHLRWEMGTMPCF